MVNNRTIVALSTSPINSALGIIRISGLKTYDILNKIFYNNKQNKEHGKFYYGEIVDNETKLDEVVVLCYKNPKSFTGEDLVEIICHGNIILINKIINLIIKNGAELAFKGEFSEKAFFNGKINLLKAEAINDLVKAKTELSQKIATKNIFNQDTNNLKNIKKMFMDLIAAIEVNIDYPEYDSVDMDLKLTKTKVNEIKKEINKIIQNHKIYKTIQNGIKTAIIGKPNVGKSSLLNLLINENKAIVSNISGTTRDIVEGEIYLNDILLKILDTAGIRESKNKNEKLGIIKTINAISHAHLIIYIVDKDFHIDPSIQNKLTNKNVIYVQNKKDKYKKRDSKFISISVKDNNIQELLKEIEKRFQTTYLNFENEAIYPDSKITFFEKINLILNDTLKLIKEKTSIELLTLNLHEAYNLIEEILGENIKEDIISALFRNYCLGK